MWLQKCLQFYHEMIKRKEDKNFTLKKERIKLCENIIRQEKMIMPDSKVLELKYLKKSKESLNKKLMSKKSIL